MFVSAIRAWSCIESLIGIFAQPSGRRDAYLQVGFASMWLLLFALAGFCISLCSLA
jgi:hypothetical protein